MTSSHLTFTDLAQNAEWLRAIGFDEPTPLPTITVAEALADAGYLDSDSGVLLVEHMPTVYAQMQSRFLSSLPSGLLDDAGSLGGIVAYCADVVTGLALVGLDCGTVHDAHERIADTLASFDCEGLALDLGCPAVLSAMVTRDQAAAESNDGYAFLDGDEPGTELVRIVQRFVALAGVAAADLLTLALFDGSEQP